MGVDQRGINRGKCKVADCDCTEFHLVQDALFCGYCGDPPAKHQDLAAPTTSTSPNNNDSSETVLLGIVPKEKEKWMDKKLGWITYPKRATGVFYNEVLQSFYKSYWPYCPHAVSFQQAFIVKRNRRWQWNKKVNGLKQQILTFKSSNPAFAGRNLDGDTYKPHKNDADNINRLLHDLNCIKDDLDIAMSEIRKQDDSLFRSISGKLKSGRDSNHEFNEELINNIRDMLYDLESTFSKLSKMKELFVSIWKHKFHNTASEKKLKQRTRQNKWKIKNRSPKQLKSRMVQIFISLRGDPIDGEISPSFGINQITEIEEHALNSLFGTETCTRDKQCLQHLIDEGCFRMDALDTISNYIQD